jgi:hypothetical protein
MGRLKFGLHLVLCQLFLMKSKCQFSCFSKRVLIVHMVYGLEVNTKALSVCTC